MSLTEQEIKNTSNEILLVLERVLIEKIKDEFIGTYKLDNKGARIILAKIGLKCASEINNQI